MINVNMKLITKITSRAVLYRILTKDGGTSAIYKPKLYCDVANA